MGLNHTPSAERIHIGFFGRRNAGKSSVVNAITGQELAVVSDVKGTTTDPVQKAMELLPMGPVVLIDTPGIDDEGELGELRVKKTKQILNKIDIAVLVIDVTEGKTQWEQELLALFQEKQIKYLIVYNKSDLQKQEEKEIECFTEEIYVSVKTNYHIHELKEKIAALAMLDKKEENQKKIIGDFLNPEDFVVLVVPIDESAPKGRLILPQQQTIRDILESDATAIVVKDNKLSETLQNLGKKPKLVITDSQVFAKANQDTPKDVLLTSFSILFARYKGDLETVVKGAAIISDLQDGDQILISEGCTHHRQCEDIGSVKLPRWLKEYTKKQLEITLTSGTEFPEDLSQYRLIIHCGACMLNQREMQYRLKNAVDAGIPITNYGIAIAYMKGILKRSVELFPEIFSILEK